MNKSVREVITQIVAMILAFIGAMLLVGTFIPLLNPPIWRDVTAHSGNNGVGGWSHGQYALWYAGGIGLSLILLAVSWLLNTANKKNKMK